MKIWLALFLLASSLGAALTCYSESQVYKSVSATERSKGSAGQYLQAGISLREVHTIDAEDRKSPWDTTSGNWSLVFVFTGNCPACGAASPTFKDLTSFLGDDLPLNIILLNMRPWQLTLAQSFVATHELRGDLLSFDREAVPFSDRDGNRYKITPQLLLVDPAGEIVRVRAGKWSQAENESWVVDIYERLGSVPADKGITK